MTLVGADKIDQFVQRQPRALAPFQAWKRGVSGDMGETFGYKEPIPLGGFPAGKPCNF